MLLDLIFLSLNKDLITYFLEVVNAAYFSLLSPISSSSDIDYRLFLSLPWAIYPDGNYKQHFVRTSMPFEKENVTYTYSAHVVAI